jgi:RNA polymerase sigma factor (TIGR02999 family)
MIYDWAPPPFTTHCANGGESPSSIPQDGGSSIPVHDRRSFDELFISTYDELKRLASALHASSQGEALTPTALVHEAWLKMAVSPPPCVSNLHFKRITARAMRRLLVDSARRRNALKRCRREGTVSSLETDVCTLREDLLALNHALAHLQRVRPRQAAVVRHRFFAGMDINEIAAELRISTETVTRDWRSAREWLADRLRSDLSHTTN